MNNNKNNTSRREFLKKTGIIAGVSLTFIPLASLLNSCEEDQEVPTKPPVVIPEGGIEFDLTKSEYSLLQTIGNTLVLSFTLSGSTTKCVVRRTSDKEFVVVDITKGCPHLFQPFIIPKTANDKLVCSFHKAEFNLGAEPDKRGTVADAKGYQVTDLSWYNYAFNETTNKLFIKQCGGNCPPK